MVLAHSLFVKRAKALSWKRTNGTPSTIAATISLVAAVIFYSPATSASSRTKIFSQSYDAEIQVPDSSIPQRAVDYSELRMAALNLIAGASRKVWLVSEFFSDSEIVSSLFMAQFRKLDAQVVVGPARSADPLSRVSFLMNQKIPTFIRPRNWTLPYESALLTDEQLVWVNGSFDPYSARREFRLVIATDEEKRSFEQSFLSATGQKLTPHVRPPANVGRPASNYAPSNARSTTRSDDPLTSSGVYNYNRVKHDRSAPSGIVTKLPKQTISQKREQERSQPLGAEDSKSESTDEN